MKLTRATSYGLAVLVLAVALIAVWAAGLPLGLRFGVAGLMLVAAAGAIYERKRKSDAPR